MRVPVFLAVSLGLFAVAATAVSSAAAVLVERELRRERAGAAATAEMESFLDSKLAVPAVGPQGPSLASGLAGPVTSHQLAAERARNVAAFRAAEASERADRVFLFKRGSAVSGSQSAWPATLQTYRRDLVRYQAGPVEVIAAMHGFPNGDRLLIGRAVAQAGPFHPAVLRVNLATAAGLILSGMAITGAFAAGYDRRLRAITDACERVERGEMTARAPGADKSDEFGALSRRVNRMLDRVQRYVDGMRNVSDEIAHDLRTPLNRMQASLVSVRERLPADERGAADAALAGVGDLVRTVDDFLWLREVEAGQGGETAFLGLKGLCEAVAEDHALLAEETKGVRLTVAGEDAEVMGVRSLLVRAVDNIVANAVKFTPRGGAIAVRVERRSGQARIVVEDSGPGMDPDLLARAVQPGVRGAVEGAGHGLGLAIAASVARRHGGDLTLTNLRPNGLRVTLDLPTVA